MKRYVVYIFGLLFCLLSSASMAATSSPLEMLQTTSDHMLSELKSQKATMKSDPDTVFDIVNEILLPHADMDTMAKSVVGRTAWTSATPAQQEAFIAQFTELLIRTYAAALASYSNQTVQFFPIRGGWQNQNQVQVQSQINQPNGPPIPMSYRLLLEGQDWKVIDFSVDNVSLVENFRAQFANDLNQGGLANLTAKLAQHNAQLEKQET